MTGERTADIALVISDLGDGGAQRVLVQLAAHWSGAGRSVTIITQAGPESDFFDIPNGVRRMAAGGLGPSPNLVQRLFANLRRIRLLRRAMRDTGAPIVVSFVGRTVIATIIAHLGLPMRLIISERNDPRRQSLRPAWDILRRVLYRRADVVTVPRVKDGRTSVWAQYTLVLDDRDRVQAALKDARIPTAIYYPIPLSPHTAYRDFPASPTGPMISEDLSRRVLSLPMPPVPRRGNPRLHHRGCPRSVR